MLNKFKQKTSFFLILFSIIEIVFFFDVLNIWATLILLFGWNISKKFVLTKQNMIKYPVSFFMVFGLTLFHYVLPIPLTLIELKPVTYNLVMPFETFLNHGLFLLVLVITHFFYRKITERNNLFRSVLKKTNFYKKPTNFQIWSTSLAALVFSAYFYFIYGSWENYEDKNILITIGQSFGAYLWMPIIIPFYKVRQVDSKMTNKTKGFIIGYSLLVVIIAVVSNWRTILYAGFVIFLLIYLIGLLYGYYELKKNFTTNKIIIMFIVIYIISGPVMDLGTAMVITRQTRYTTSSSDFLKNTLDTYQDKDMLRKFNAVISNNGVIDYSIKKWDEEYLSNYVLNRFCNLKISDNCIYYANKIGFANENMQNVLLDQVVSFVPGFISNAINFKSETRGEIYKSSITDNLYSLAINDTTVKGSAIIGSMPGVGLSIFGYWYLIVIIPIFLIIFTMFDSFAYVYKNKVYFSYYFFTVVFIAFNFFNDRHVYNFELKWILRTYVESIILFLVVFNFTKNIEKYFLKR